MGVQKSYVTKLGQQGRLVETADGQVDIDATLRRVRETADPNRDDVSARHTAQRGADAGHGAQNDAGVGQPYQPAQKSAQSASDGVGSSYQASRAVKERYLALQAKRDYELACGQLMRADDVAAAVSSAATTLRTRLESLPDQLAAQLGPHLDETQRRSAAADLIETILTGLSADFAKLAKDAHAPA